mmetsp:Transcript_22373/g.70078  ORF Transcript_22373/g.70078 Transcript_22373/m.70078 type:complete len:224 (+) Transcript_22373:1689-2360(+)
MLWAACSFRVYRDGGWLWVRCVLLSLRFRVVAQAPRRLHVPPTLGDAWACSRGRLRTFSSPSGWPRWFRCRAAAPVRLALPFWVRRRAALPRVFTPRVVALAGPSPCARLSLALAAVRFGSGCFPACCAPGLVPSSCPSRPARRIWFRSVVPWAPPGCIGLLLREKPPPCFCVYPLVLALMRTPFEKGYMQPFVSFSCAAFPLFWASCPLFIPSHSELGSLVR